ncbi:hypothetical protein RR48_13017 [Papilio machaon]|uniref:C2H2-type domain-containing protein n=1 Tax=Papilio machaon TaxID=76193 RepID=A0A194QRY2_PAPMA|nr:hypothetical protein RR48_13017 [Papilio machaon]
MTKVGQCFFNLIFSRFVAKWRVQCATCRRCPRERRMPRGMGRILIEEDSEMNFTAFSAVGGAGTHFITTGGQLPVAKLQQNISNNGGTMSQVVGVMGGVSLPDGMQYVRTLDGGATLQTPQLITVPIALPGAKPVPVNFTSNTAESSQGAEGSEGVSWRVLDNTELIKYLNSLPPQEAEALPSSLQQYLRLNVKRDWPEDGSATSEEKQVLDADGVLRVKKKKKYKKKPPKPARPKPGQVVIAKASDGTAVYCCPECQMAYPAKEQLEMHLIVHKIERRFICGICGAGKDHLRKHARSHESRRARDGHAAEDKPAILAQSASHDDNMPGITIHVPTSSNSQMPIQISIPQHVVSSLQAQNAPIDAHSQLDALLADNS